MVEAAPHCFDVGALVKHPVTVNARFQELHSLAKEQGAKRMADDMIQVSIHVAGCLRFVYRIM